MYEPQLHLFLPKFHRITFPKKLIILPNSELMHDRQEVEEYVRGKAIPQGATYIAYVEQLQRYDKTFREISITDEEQFKLNEGDIFCIGYANGPLLHKKPEQTAESLAQVVQFGHFSLATRIEDVVAQADGDSRLTYTKKGNVVDRFATAFYRAMTEWKGREPGWGWTRNYPHVTIVTVNLPELTDQIVAAGKELKAKTRVLR